MGKERKKIISISLLISALFLLSISLVNSNIYKIIYNFLGSYYSLLTIYLIIFAIIINFKDDLYEMISFRIKFFLLFLFQIEIFNLYFNIGNIISKQEIVNYILSNYWERKGILLTVLLGTLFNLLNKKVIIILNSLVSPLVFLIAFGKIIGFLYRKIKTIKKKKTNKKETVKIKNHKYEDIFLDDKKEKLRKQIKDRLEKEENNNEKKQSKRIKYDFNFNKKYFKNDFFENIKSNQEKENKEIQNLAKEIKEAEKVKKEEKKAEKETKKMNFFERRKKIKELKRKHKEKLKQEREERERKIREIKNRKEEKININEIKTEPKKTKVKEEKEIEIKILDESLKEEKNINDEKIEDNKNIVEEKKVIEEIQKEKEKKIKEVQEKDEELKELENKKFVQEKIFEKNDIIEKEYKELANINKLEVQTLFKEENNLKPDIQEKKKENQNIKLDFDAKKNSEQIEKIKNNVIEKKSKQPEKKEIKEEAKKDDNLKEKFFIDIFGEELYNKILLEVRNNQKDIIYLQTKYKVGLFMTKKLLDYLKEEKNDISL